MKNLFKTNVPFNVYYWYTKDEIRVDGAVPWTCKYCHKVVWVVAGEFQLQGHVQRKHGYIPPRIRTPEAPPVQERPTPAGPPGKFPVKSPSGELLLDPPVNRRASSSDESLDSVRKKYNPFSPIRPGFLEPKRRKRDDDNDGGRDVMLEPAPPLNTDISHGLYVDSKASARGVALRPVEHMKTAEAKLRRERARSMLNQAIAQRERMDGTIPTPVEDKLYLPLETPTPAPTGFGRVTSDITSYSQSTPDKKRNQGLQGSALIGLTTPCADISSVKSTALTSSTIKKKECEEGIHRLYQKLATAESQLKATQKKCDTDILSLDRAWKSQFNLKNIIKQLRDEICTTSQDLLNANNELILAIDENKELLKANADLSKIEDDYWNLTEVIEDMQKEVDQVDNLKSMVNAKAQMVAALQAENELLRAQVLRPLTTKYSKANSIMQIANHQD
ncbi:hypothetical protein EDC01DRAFT_630661 [Geopyxis carbonaria]|nr:hypothetical protein EDC01DRAFT_630661 [Geopyxis carbonaria]